MKYGKRVIEFDLYFTVPDDARKYVAVKHPFRLYRPICNVRGEMEFVDHL